MAVVTGVFPYDIDNLLGGSARVLYSDDDPLPALPDNINDIIDCEGPYAPQTGWFDFGATKEAASYTRDMESEGYEIQQTSGFVLEEITDVTRTLTVSVAEVKAEHLQILEEGSAPETVAAIANEAVAQKAVKFGSISDLTHRRVAFIAQRRKQSGTVTEAVSGEVRGRLVCCVLYNCAIEADSSEVEMEKGSLVELPVSFRAFPESGETSGEEHGTWLTEDAGTIAGA